MIIYFVSLIIIIIIIFYYFNNKVLFNIENKENFYVTTWSPYIIDFEYQPGFTNYFYNNGYMYPIY